MALSKAEMAALEEIKVCEGQRAEIVLAMDKLVEAFKVSFRLPCPLYLSKQSLASGAVYLRWRKSGVKGKQPYIQLESELGQVILGSLPGSVWGSYLRFQEQVIGLNFRHASLLAEQRRLMFYWEQLQIFRRLKTQFLAVDVKN